MVAKVSIDLTEVEDAINEESWDWLSDNIPQMAKAIQAAVIKKNAKPEQIKFKVMQLTFRPKLAMRCYQAASHLADANEQ
jgi:glucose-6-phosphate-specific signal transduction histidine kinase